MPPEARGLFIHFPPFNQMTIKDKHQHVSNEKATQTGSNVWTLLLNSNVLITPLVDQRMSQSTDCSVWVCVCRPPTPLYNTSQHSAVHMRTLVAVTTFHFATCSLGGNLLYQSDAGFSTAEGGGVKSQPSNIWTTTPHLSRRCPCLWVYCLQYILCAVLNLAAVWPFLTHRGEDRSSHIVKLKSFNLII